MITITNIRNVDHVAYDEVWAIVRSLKHPGKMRHVPELSPSCKLFRQYLQLRNNGRWNSEAFQSLYVPTFLQEMQNVAVKKKLNELVWLDRQGRRIALVCFCSDEATCHRSIIAGILQYVGTQIQGVQNNYHQYGGAYMNVQEGIMNEVIEKMRKDGYPYKIKGNGGYTAVLYDMQPLFNGDYMAIYRYPRGECCHDLMEIRMHFEIIEQQIDLEDMEVSDMFMIMFLLDLIGLVTGGIRFFLCWIAESIKADCFSSHRRMVWRNVWIHFGVTILFFYLAFYI